MILKAKGVVEGEAKGRAEGRTEGRAGGLRATVVRVGEKRYGEASVSVFDALAAADFETLQGYVERLAEAESWDEPLAQGA